MADAVDEPVDVAVAEALDVDETTALKDAVALAHALNDAVLELELNEVAVEDAVKDADALAVPLDVAEESAVEEPLPVKVADTVAAPLPLLVDVEAPDAVAVALAEPVALAEDVAEDVDVADDVALAVAVLDGEPVEALDRVPLGEVLGVLEALRVDAAAIDESDVRELEPLRDADPD